MQAPAKGAAGRWGLGAGVLAGAWLMGEAGRGATGAPWLSLAIWIPIAGGVGVLFTGDDKQAPLARSVALITAFAGFVVTIPLYTGFDVTAHGMQFQEMQPWVERFNVSYHLGVDGISLVFLLLNSFVTLLVVM